MKAKRLISHLKKFFNQRGFSKSVVGLSGGVDSAVTLAIATKALGSENVFALILPEAGVSSPLSAQLAEQVAAKFGITTYTRDLTDSLRTFIGLPWRFSAEANQNIRPRLRMTLLYHFALTKKALVLGTSNKSEMLLGYGTKFGDFAADVEVLGNIWKTDVYKFAKELKIPSEIIDRPPTAELTPGQTDAKELGAGYAQLDIILKKLEKNNFELSKDLTDFEQEILTRVLANKHKTELVPVL
ncbi:NAD(+) synthase [Candidatus Gracilibacteria bacterium]|nr:NAD(+) synthase [Candidatus Gracilibacteria bacterium]MCF7856750.1 NAD(+) synthase [Candidatus Gracilibacteria bacterium]MCF7897044.1 NAD(+) synthase [Candidatus Gracilibacteria bacterium]